MEYKKYDNFDMFQSIYSLPEQLRQAKKIGNAIQLSKSYSNIKNIVIAGMGGSAVGGDLLISIFQDHLEVPIFVSRNYTLPHWVDSNTLVVCSSYSGNTEETLSSFKEAKKRNTYIIGITTGGELLSCLDVGNYEKVIIPDGLQPRSAVGFSLIPLVFLIQNIFSIDIGIQDKIKNVIDCLIKKRELYSISDESNLTLNLAKQIYNKLIVLYSETGKTDKLAVRIKGQICENSKMLCYNNEIPELNHNEIVGWKNNPKILNNIFIIWLVDKDGHNRNAHRIKITKEILNTLNVEQYNLSFNDKSYFERFFNFIYFGDWLSYWCAIINQTDPTPVDNINFLKKKLNSI